MRRMHILAGAMILSAGAAWADLPFDVVALAGKQVPGLAMNENYSLFTYATGNASGQIGLGALASGVSITFSNDGVVLAGDRNALELIAREGDPAPVTGGDLYQFTSAPSLTSDGTAVFRSTLNPSGFGFFSHAPGSATKLLSRDGGPVDNTSTVLLGTTVFGNRYAVDDSGGAYAISNLQGSAVTAGDQYAIIRTSDTSTTTVARTGITLPPGEAVGVVYDSFVFVNANAAGQVAFEAMLRNMPADQDVGYWVRGGGSIFLVTRESKHAPGLPAAVTFGQMGSAIGIGDDGTVAFCALLAGTGVTSDNDSSLWAGKPGALKLIAREGDAAPELDPGVVFDDFLYASTVDIAPAVSSKGRVAFLARVRGPGITDTNNDGLWVQDGDGVLRLVLREGTLIPSGNNMNQGIGNSTALISPFTLDPIASFKNPLKLLFSAETGNGSFDGVYEADVPPPTFDTIRPTVKIRGPAKRSTKARRIRLLGNATDNTAVARVEYRIGRGGIRIALGTTNWRLKAKLKIGRNSILVRSVDTAGNTSPFARVKIRRLRS